MEINTNFRKKNFKENRRGNQEWTIQRHLHHWAHKTQDEYKPPPPQKKKPNQQPNTQHRKRKTMNNIDPIKSTWGVLGCSERGCSFYSTRDTINIARNSYKTNCLK